MDITVAEIEELQQKIAAIEERRSDPNHRRKSVVTSVAVSENGQAPVPVVLTEATDGGVAGISEEELAAIRHEWDLEIEQEMQALTAQVASMTLQRDQLQILLDNVKNETRTDVIKRLEDELAAKQESLSALTEASMKAKANDTKRNTKIEELRERAERAEAELVERDERYLRDLSESEEKRLLAEQVAKQREDIILKSQAATSGWDAAAHAEEMLDIEVDRAYQNGLKEGKAVVEGDIASLHASIEEKDKRNIELLEKIGALVSAVKEAELKVGQAEKASSLAVRQARASGGGGGGALDEETVDELRQVREELDSAQEECIVTAEQLASAQQELTICREQINIYKTLLAQFGAAPTPTATSTAPSVEIVVDPADAARAKDELAQMEESIRSAIVVGSKLWKEGKRDECFALYLGLNERLHDQLKTLELKDPLATAQEAANDVPKSKGAVILRKSLDKLLEDISDDTATFDAEVKAQAGGTAQPAKAKSNAAVAATSGAGTQSIAVQQMQAKLAALDKKRNELASMAASDVQADSGVSAALLRRAKEAEEKVIDLRNQLADAMSKPGAGGKRGSGGGGGADSAEVKRLQKRIKDLEASGSGGGGGDKKALATAEKGFQKKLKELDTANRKEKSALEGRAKAAEKDLADTTEKLQDAIDERDKLRAKVKELGNMSSEMEALRNRAAQADEFAAIITENNAEIQRLTEQYKKEGMLRKKYKNELEDLKGAIRVYARMRPMAQYERDRGCQQIVRFTDETSLKVQTSRGEKEFEFDAAFTHTSTQDEVFEDTKRLVESFLDGYNVCLFAYGQTGSGKYPLVLFFSEWS